MEIKKSNKKLESRVERAILRACKHPAIQNPLSYNFDTPRSLTIIFVLSLTVVAIWHSYIREPLHAMAPTESTLIMQLAGE